MKRKNKKILSAPIAEPIKPHFNVTDASQFSVGLNATQPMQTYYAQAGIRNGIPNGMPCGLPQFTSVDEYGRVYSPTISYGPMPHSAPVPVPIPAKVVQLSPIVSPVSFVPYNTQNQELYTFDDED